MARPGDWHVLELDRDPTPGDPPVVARVARAWSAFADDVAAAAAGVRSLAGDRATLTWIGAAGEVFAGAVGAFPGDLDRCEESYRRGAQALARWSGELEGCQEQADRALALGRSALADLQAASAAVELAVASAGPAAARAEVLRAEALQAGPAPDPEQVRHAVRTAHVAHARVEAARAEAAGARSRLDAARRLALDAQAVREDRGRTAARAVDEATSAGLPPRSWWDSVEDVAARVWQGAVEVAKVAVVVLAVVAIIIGGPLVWGIVAGLSAVILADAVGRYARGEADGWEVGLAALGCIPGGRGLTTVAQLRTALATGRQALGAAQLLPAGRQALTAGAGGLRAFAASGARTADPGSGLVTVERLLAGGRVRDLASRVPGSDRVALHAGSADRPVLKALYRREYGHLDVVNVERYARYVPGFDTNCTRCVIAADHTIAGSPASALPVLSRSGAPITDVSRHFGRTWEQMRTYDDIVARMDELGEGARGVVFGLGERFGHVFTVVHDKNGVVFLDTQRGQFAELFDFRQLRLLATAP